MNAGNKNTLGIVLVSIIIALFLGYDGIVIAEFHTAKYGEEVKAKVIDVSELCRNKNKYVTLLIEGKNKEIRVYGRSCREDEFPLNGQVTVKINRRLNIITLPNNSALPRLIVFPVMTLFMAIALIQLIKQRRKFSQVKDEE